MPGRYRSRQRAMQILYNLDVRKMPVPDAIEGFYGTLYDTEVDHEADVERPEPDPFMEALVRGTVAQTELIDATLRRHSENWRLERMSAVDRNILRLAIYEMLAEGTPPPVVIDQALELARRFSSMESVKFINGVLDAVRKGFAGPEAPKGEI